MTTNEYQSNVVLLTTYFVYSHIIAVGSFPAEMKVNIPDRDVTGMGYLVINEGYPLEITCVQNEEFAFFFFQNNEYIVSNFARFFQLLLFFFFVFIVYQFI